MITILKIEPTYKIIGSITSISAWTVEFRLSKVLPNGDQTKLIGELKYQTENEYFDLQEIKERIMKDLEL